MQADYSKYSNTNLELKYCINITFMVYINPFHDVEDNVDIAEPVEYFFQCVM